MAEKGNEDLPIVSRKNGRTKFRATVGLSLGLGMVNSGFLAEYCNKYPGDVKVTKIVGRTRQNIDGKSILQTMMLAATKGSSLEFNLGWVDKSADEFAAKVYRALKYQDCRDYRDAMEDRTR